MNAHELSQRLAQEGCNALLYAVGPRGAVADAFCLTQTGALWNVYYTERGQDSPPIFTSHSESQACDFFFQHIMSVRHDHCVGVFRDKRNATALRKSLQGYGLSSWEDRIHFGGTCDSQFRVFVTGKAIFPAKSIIGQVPVRDEQMRRPAPASGH